MRLDLTVHLSPEDRKLLDRMATAQERAAAAAEKAAASLDSIDKYFKRLNRATTATITPGKVTEQE